MRLDNCCACMRQSYTWSPAHRRNTTLRNNNTPPPPPTIPPHLDPQPTAVKTVQNARRYLTRQQKHANLEQHAACVSIWQGNSCHTTQEELHRKTRLLLNARSCCFLLLLRCTATRGCWRGLVLVASLPHDASRETLSLSVEHLPSLLSLTISKLQMLSGPPNPRTVCKGTKADGEQG